MAEARRLQVSEASQPTWAPDRYWISHEKKKHIYKYKLTHISIPKDTVTANVLKWYKTGIEVINRMFQSFYICTVRSASNTVNKTIQIKTVHIHNSFGPKRTERKEQRAPAGFECVNENLPITNRLHFFYEHAVLDKATHFVWIQAQIS